MKVQISKLEVLTYASKCDTNINKVVERVIVRYDLLLCSNLPPTDDKCLFSSQLHTHTSLKRGPQTASDVSSSNVIGKKYKILLEFKVKVFSKYSDDKKFHRNHKIKFKP